MLQFMNELYTVQPRVGYAYVPYQTFGEIYGLDEAFRRGTLFPELDLPYGVYEGGLKDD